MYRIYEAGGGPQPVAPEWIDLSQAITLIGCVVGFENSDRCLRELLCSEVVPWRAKEGKQNDKGELQELSGLQLDACGLRAILFSSKFVQ